MRFSTLPLLHETLWPWDVGVRHGNMLVMSRSVANRDMIFVARRGIGVLGDGLIPPALNPQPADSTPHYYTHGLK